MRRIRTTIALVLVATAALLGTGPTATAAPAPYGPAVPLLTNCGSSSQPADAAMAADGAVRGFANCVRTESGSILYFRHRGGTVFSQPTPYTGVVIKVAWDGLASTYLLFGRPGPDPTTEQLFIGKRLDNTGQYAPPTLLATTHRGSLPHSLRPIQAALVAYAGKWWAVWTEPTREVAGTLIYSLFQRHTLLGVQPRTRITYPSAGADDSAPSLAYSAGLLTALWLRKPSAGAGAGYVMLGRLSGAATWTARPVFDAVPGTTLTSTDLIQYVGVRYATWTLPYEVFVAANVLGTFRPRGFAATDAVASTVAVSGQNLFLMWWTGPDVGGSHVVLVERQAGVWSSPTTIADASFGVRVLAQGGKGRLVYWSGSTLTLRVQT